MAEIKGKLIVIDGGDGAGKATQAKLLRERLATVGHEVETIDFPRYQNNHFGGLIRECLDGQRGDFMSIDPKIAAVLYAADRFETKKVIEDWLAEGKTVVLDRYVSANVIHQCAKLENREDWPKLLSWIEKMEYEVFAIPRPDITFYLDIPYEKRQALKAEAVATGKHTGELDVAEKDQDHQRFAEECARKITKSKEDWQHIVCVDSNSELCTPQDIHQEIFGIVERSLN